MHRNSESAFNREHVSNLTLMHHSHMKTEVISSRAIVLMGVSGCGKSTVGRLLATELNCPFTEGDEFHSDSSIAKMRAGQSLSDEDRWPWLDRIGKALQSAVFENGVAVTSCSALKKTYRERLAAAIAAPTSFVLLNVGREELQTRLQTRSDHFMPATLLESQLALLERPTHAESALVVDANSHPEALCKIIRAWLDPSASM
jgi:gluconokinase